jgi:hypothetical protein
MHIPVAYNPWCQIARSKDVLNLKHVETILNILDRGTLTVAPVLSSEGCLEFVKTLLNVLLLNASLCTWWFV